MLVAAALSWAWKAVAPASPPGAGWPSTQEGLPASAAAALAADDACLAGGATTCALSALQARGRKRLDWTSPPTAAAPVLAAPLRGLAIAVRAGGTAASNGLAANEVRPELLPSLRPPPKPGDGPVWPAALRRLLAAPALLCLHASSVVRSHGNGSEVAFLLALVAVLLLLLLGSCLALASMRPKLLGSGRNSQVEDPPEGGGRPPPPLPPFIRQARDANSAGRRPLESRQSRREAMCC